LRSWNPPRGLGAVLPALALPLPLASFALDLTFVGVLLAAEALVVSATWLSVALDAHGRARVLELAEAAGCRDRAARALALAGVYELSLRLVRFLGSALLVVGIAFLCLHGRWSRGASDALFPWAELGVALGIAFVLHFLVNDVAVRLLARRHPNSAFVAALPWLEVARIGTAPLRVPLAWIVRVLFRVQLQELGPSAREEVLETLEEGEREGSFTSDEAEMIESIIDMGQVTVEDVLTPRSDMAMLPRDTTLREAIEFVLEDGHSRIPVYGRDRDEVIGILYAHDLLVHASRGTTGRPIASIMRPAFFVPETKPLNALLNEMRGRKVHMAIVLNEYGGTAGLVTIEDVLEEIVGEIEDEYDEGEATPEQTGSDTLLVEGRTPIEEVNRALEIALPVPEDFETVGGLVFHRLGKVPQKGDRVTVDNVALTVTDADERTVKQLRVEVLPRSE
jgi:CBS domain containing-hemolysin-like protein